MRFNILHLFKGVFSLLKSLLSFKGKNVGAHDSVKFQKTLFNILPII